MFVSSVNTERLAFEVERMRSPESAPHASHRLTGVNSRRVANTNEDLLREWTRVGINRYVLTAL